MMRRFLKSLLFPGKKRSFFRRFVVTPFLWLGFLGVVVGVIGAIYFHGRALTFSLKELEELPERTLVYDRQGGSMGYVAGHGENRVSVSLDEVSPFFVTALLAREDARFYEHGGVDVRGVGRAALSNLKAGGFEQGASTITMQLARNTWGLKQRTLARKAQEVALAQRLERRLEKDEILEHYMNRIYFGSGLYGIERAAQGFFMKPASELSLGESAMLAGVIRGPSLLNPFRSIDSAKGVRDEVLDRLLAEQRIDAAEAEAAKNEPIRLRPPSQRTATGSYVLQSIHDVLGELLTDEDINAGGLRIYTTIEPAIQSAAERGLDSHLSRIERQPGFPHPARNAGGQNSALAETRYVQGAVVSIENQTGAILAIVGGRDFDESPFNRALDARRQCGSTFKPFVYAAAFDRGGLMPGTWVSDDPIRYDQGNGQVWSPANSDGQFLGNQPAAVGLIRSRNTMSIRVGEIAGLENVRGLARALKMGDIPDSPVSFLGAFETTPMTLTSAYSTFASGGENRAPYLIERIENAEGELLFRAEVRALPLLRESVSWLTTDILGEVMNRGTGASARQLGFTDPCYGKTGTTNDYRDAWFVGYTAAVTTGVWVGMDRPVTIMNRGYGSTLAIPVWVEVMKTAGASGYPAGSISLPGNAEEVDLCRACGGLAQRRSLDPYRMAFPTDLWPSHRCPGHGKGGLLDLFTGAEEGGRRPYPTRDQKPGGLGEAVRGVGRFLFGPSQ